MLSLFVMVYLLLPTNPWQIFLIAVLAEVLVFLSCNIKKPRKPRKSAENSGFYES